MERETGIEPALVAWKATVLPLNYSRSGILQYIQIQARKRKIGWWREVDYSGRPALRPSGASLRLFKIAPGDFVEPSFISSVVLIHLTYAVPHLILWWREVDYSGRPALRPSGASLRLFKIAPGDFFEPSFISSVVLIHLTYAVPHLILWWREVDSNHRRHEPADLQSAPVGRLGIPPKIRLCRPTSNRPRGSVSRGMTEPVIVRSRTCSCQGGTDSARSGFNPAAAGGRRRGNVRSPETDSCPVP